MQQPLAKKPPKGISPASSSPGQGFSPLTDFGGPGPGSQLAPITLNSTQIGRFLKDQFDQVRASDDLLNRLSTHVTVVILVLLAVGLSTVQWPWGSVRVIQPLKGSSASVAQPVPTRPAQEQGIPITQPGQLNTTPGDVFSRAAVPHTIIPERARQEISAYRVESGDTIYGIANKLGLAPETIMWSNPGLEDYPDMLQVGQELVILPVDGVYHQVGGGDTIEGIASTYKTDPALILSFPLNNLDPDNPAIEAGQWLVVPGGSKPFVPRTVTAYTGPVPADATLGSGAFVWPASGVIYQGYWGGHPAIDVAAWTGAPILAADSGYVIVAGWDNSGYGYHVVIDHGNGYQTLYAHLEAYYVDAGQNVAKGQQIGEMGSTGRSTGPHLHFEVRQGTVQRNPVGFLP